MHLLCCAIYQVSYMVITDLYVHGKSTSKFMSVWLRLFLAFCLSFFLSFPLNELSCTYCPLDGSKCMRKFIQCVRSLQWSTINWENSAIKSLCTVIKKKSQCSHQIDVDFGECIFFSEKMFTSYSTFITLRLQFLLVQNTYYIWIRDSVCCKLNTTVICVNSYTHMVLSGNAGVTKR